MSVFIASITDLSQNFFNSDPLKFNDYFAITPDYQKYCLNANLPTRFTITLAKEVMLIHDIAIHLLAGGCKLTTGTVKGICATASGILGIETDHQTPSKQAAVHIGFACVYTVDFFVSITNINKRYPQHLIDKIKSIFTRFLEVPSKGTTIEYIVDPKIEEALKRTQAETKKKELALQEEQRKAKEQDALLKRTQQELENTLNTEFIPKEELEEIFEKAHRIAAEKVNEENSTKKAIYKEAPSFLSNKNLDLAYNPSQFNLTYIESDDGFWSEEVFGLPIESDDGFWSEEAFGLPPDTFDNELGLVSFEEQDLKEDEIKKNLAVNLPLTASNKSENPKIVVQPPQASKNSNKKISPKSNTSESARARSLKYANDRQKRPKKKLSLASS